jgi:hypothetical protein
MSNERHDMPRHFDASLHRDIIVGYQFIATLQLRTPLRVLKRHGEIHKLPNYEPPMITREAWEGTWVPKTRVTFPQSMMASDIGPIPADGGDYLKFLISVRTIAERNEAATDRRKALEAELKNEKWRDFVRKLGGSIVILDQLFPAFLSSIPRLAQKASETLCKKGLTTPVALMSASDDELLSVQGLGAASLRAIREASTTAKNTNDPFVENIVR